MAFKINDGDAHYYRADLDSVLKAVFTPEYRATWEKQPELRAKAIQEHAKGAQEVTGMEGLTEMVAYLNDWSSRVSNTQDARREEVIKLINEGHDVDAVREAAGVTWSTLAAWAIPAEKKGKETPEPRVDEATVVRILAETDAIAARAQAKIDEKRDRADANSRFSLLLAEIEDKRKEYKAISGQAYVAGRGMDDDLDALIVKRQNFYAPAPA